jgi:hypothetical protein
MPDVFDFATEVRFWRHCSKKTDLPDRSSFVQKWLAGNDRQIRAAHDGTAYAGWTAAQVAQTVERAHTELMRTIPPEDLALYRVYQLAYALDNKVAECKCRYIILDNVDHLDPDVQRTSVDFVEKMASTLRARAAITIRPLTWRRAFDAHVLVRTENHCSPKFADVLTKRLDAMIDTHSLTSNGEAL